jgi:hypothetical protein
MGSRARRISASWIRSRRPVSRARWSASRSGEAGTQSRMRKSPSLLSMAPERALQEYLLGKHRCSSGQGIPIVGIRTTTRQTNFGKGRGSRARASVPCQFLRHGVCIFDRNDHSHHCHHRRYQQRYGAGASDQRLHHRWARDALRHHERPGWSGCRSLWGDEAQDWRSRPRSLCPWPNSQVKLG